MLNVGNNYFHLSVLCNIAPGNLIVLTYEPVSSWTLNYLFITKDFIGKTSAPIGKSDFQCNSLNVQH